MDSIPRRRRQTVTPGDAGEDGDFVQLRLIRESTIKNAGLQSDASEISLNQSPETNGAIKSKRNNSSDGTKVSTTILRDLFVALKTKDRAKIDGELYKAKKLMSMDKIRHPKTNETVLHVAVANDMKDFAGYLISTESASYVQLHHVVKHSGSEGKRNALHIATEKGDALMARSLVRKMNGKTDMLNLISQETAVDIQGQRPRLFSCLHLAAYYGHTDLVRLYLDEGMSVNHVNGKQDTALLWAARWGHNDTVRVLLNRGADPEVKNDKGSTALYWAIRYQFPQTVKILLDMGKANPNTTRKLGLVAPIIIASAFGNTEICRLLVKHPNIQINMRIRGGDTAIHNAAREGHLDIVKMLINHGAVFDGQDEVGDTPLLLAAKHGHVQVVNALLRHRADVNAMNHEGGDVWYYAIENDGMGLLKALVSEWSVKDNLKRNPLCIAASRGHCDKVRFVLDLGVDPNSTDSDGNTFLHYAALNDQHAVIEEFHSILSLDTKNHNGNTPLHISCLKGFARTTASLIVCKAKADVLNNTGETALHVAANSHKISPDTLKAVVEYMIKSHDWNSLNMKDHSGNNALHIAGQYAKPEVLWEMRFVKINDRNHDGLTPLHLAVRPGHPDVLHTMMDIFESMKRDASINEQSFSNSETVLHLAADMGHYQCVKRLIKLGADVSLQDINGDTVLHRLIKTCEYDGRNIGQHLEVFDTILGSIVKWWCIKKNISYPEHALDSLFVLYKREAMLYITHEVTNTSGLSVLNQAFKSSIPEILERLLMTENVSMFDLDECVFDISGLTTMTHVQAIRRRTSKVVPYNDTDLAEPCVRPSSTIAPSNDHVSGLELFVVNSKGDNAAQILDLPPIKSLENYYTSMVAWTFAILTMFHIVYMGVFTYIGVEVNRKLREDPGSINSSDPVTILLYVFVPIEPLVMTMFIVYRLIKIFVTGDINRQGKLSQKTGLSFVRFIVQAYALLAICLIFAGLVFVWMAMFTVRYRYQDDILASCLCFGWLLSISFTRGIRAIHFFYRMLLSMILRDVVRFLVVYVFVIMAFGFAFHVLFQISAAAAADYATPGDTLFLTFNMMIGMGELFDGSFESNLAAAGRSDTFAKAMYVLYIILSTIILLNLLIAMMNDSYSMILKENQVMWRIESVYLGMDMEASFPCFRRFSKVKIWRGKHGVPDVVDDTCDSRWYISMKDSEYDSHMHAYQKRSFNSTDAVSKRMDEMAAMIKHTNDKLQSLAAAIEQQEIAKVTRKKRKQAMSPRAAPIPEV